MALIQTFLLCLGLILHQNPCVFAHFSVLLLFPTLHWLSLVSSVFHSCNSPKPDTSGAVGCSYTFSLSVVHCPWHLTSSVLQALCEKFHVDFIDFSCKSKDSRAWPKDHRLSKQRQDGLLGREVVKGLENLRACCLSLPLSSRGKADSFSGRSETPWSPLTPELMELWQFMPAKNLLHYPGSLQLYNRNNSSALPQRGVVRIVRWESFMILW